MEQLEKSEEVQRLRAVNRHNPDQIKYFNESNAYRALLHADIDRLASLCRAVSTSKGFWDDLPRNKAEMIALIHSELSEMLEGVRKPGLMSEKCPELTLEEEEWADTLIRVLDYGHGNDLRMGKAFVEKTLFNINRPYKHGKEF